MPAPKLALVLSGGGARAAYQVGVLAAIASFRPPHTPNPFAIICGTSAGAINATAIASGASRFAIACGRLRELWWRLHVQDVYRADAPMVLRTGARWFASLLPGLAHRRPGSLLDNRPLATLLEREIPFPAIRNAIDSGHLDALTITAASYVTGLSVSFCAARSDIPLWKRAQRVGVASELGVEHLLASSAIPFIFPAVALDVAGNIEYCGDGSMRQAAPISPAVHLGAERILVIGAGRMHEPPGERVGSSEYPNLAQIAGHALSNIFLDALAVDVERLQRINATLALLPPQALESTSLKPIRVLVISPSERLDDIASRHLTSLPLPIRAMLRGVGVSGKGEDARGAALASYLLFEAPYTRELIALGVKDTMARRDEVRAFFAWQDVHAQVAVTS